jgi:ankyrin repeat protein/WD40 repeat protein
MLANDNVAGELPKFLTQPSKKILLLVVDYQSGIGQDVFQYCKKKQPLSLYVDLSQKYDIPDALSTLPLNEEHILICDGAKRHKRPENIYLNYHLERIQIKIIIICSSIALQNMMEPTLYFAPIKNSRSQKQLVQKWLLASVQPQPSPLISKQMAKEDVIDDKKKPVNHLRLHFLNQSLWTRDQSIVQSFADRILEEVCLKNLLFDLIYASREDEHMSVAAANAITILCAAGISLCGLNFRHIKIPYANLESALLEKADFSYACLDYVLFKDAFLREAIFDHADMHHVEFGRLPILDGHRSGINRLAISSDGKYAISSGSFQEDGNFRIWDMAKYKCLHNIQVDFLITDISFIPNSEKYILLAEDKKYFEIWHVGEEKCHRQYLYPLATAATLQVAPNGKSLLIGGAQSARSMLVQYEIEDEKMSQSKDLIISNKVRMSQFFGIIFSPDGRYAVSFSVQDSSAIVLIDAINFKLMKKIRINKSSNIMAVNFSADSQTLIFVCMRQLYFWSIDKDRAVYQSNCNDKLDRGAVSLAIFATKPWLAFSDMCGVIYIWDFSKNTMVNQFEAHSGLIKKLILIDNDERLISAGHDSAIKCWPINDYIKQYHCKAGHVSEVTGLVVSCDDKHLISTGADGKLYLWDTQYGQYHGELGQHELDVQGVSLSRDNKLASVAADGSAKIWNINNFKKELDFTCSKYEANCITYSPDGTMLATAGYGGIITLWDAKTASQLINLNNEANVVATETSHITALLFSTDGKYLFAGNVVGALYVWNLSSGDVVYNLREHSESISCISSTPDGSIIVTGSYDNSIIFYQFNGEILQKIELIKEIGATAHFGEISSVKVSPDGLLMATASHDGSICLWHLQERTILTLIRGDDSAVTSIAFAPDSKHLFSGHWNSSIKAWEILGNEVKLKWSVHHQLSLDNVHYESVNRLHEAYQQLFFQIVREGNGISFYLDFLKFKLKLKAAKVDMEDETAQELDLAREALSNLMKIHNDKRYSVFHGWLLKQGGLIYSQKHLMSQSPAVVLNALEIHHARVQHIFLQSLEMPNKPSNQLIRMALRYKQSLAYERNQDGATPLGLAIICRNKRVVQYLLHCGANVNYENRVGSTPVQLAVQFGYLDILILLHTWEGNLNHASAKIPPPIYYAVSNNHLSILQYLIAQGVSVKQLSYLGKPLYILHMAAASGYKNIVQCLVENGIQINEQDENGDTALNCAVTCRHGETAAYLITRGADPTIPNFKGATSLLIAVQKGLDSIVSCLLPYEDSINKTLPNGLTYVLIAIVYSHLTITQTLISRGANIASSSSDGLTAMDLAVLRSTIEIVRYLHSLNQAWLSDDPRIMKLIKLILYYDKAAERHEILVFLFGLVRNKNNQDVASGDTFLTLAVKTTYIDLIQQSCTKLNINLQDKKGISALLYAIDLNLLFPISYLLKQGADPNLVHPSSGDTPLIHAAEKGYQVIVEVLCRAGANVNSQQSQGFTALISASQNGHEAVVRFLLTRRASTTLATYNHGTTALHTAAGSGHLPIVRALIDQGVEYTQMNNTGENCLHMAAAEGRYAVVVYLVEECKKLNINAQDQQGYSAITYAARHNHLDIFQYLHRKNARLNQLDRQGNSLLRIAFISQCADILRYFITMGYRNEFQELLDQYYSAVLIEQEKQAFQTRLSDRSGLSLAMRCCDIAAVILKETAPSANTIASSEINPEESEEFLLEQAKLLSLEENQRGETSAKSNAEKKYNHSPAFFHHPSVNNATAAVTADEDMDDEELKAAIALSLRST